jgi:flavin reductase (DIM6/NTAB) family NADH-FMN oxidoreductase RutF
MMTTASKVRIHEGDPTVVRQAFAQFPSGVAVLATEIDGEKHALVASSFVVGVSLDPCLVAVAVQRTSETWDVIKEASRIGVSVFGKGQGGLTRKLAGKDRSGRFDEVAVDVDDEGAVFIDDAALWLQCSLYNIVDAGDHWMALLEVTKLGVGESEPLVWHGAKFKEVVDPDLTGIA